MNSKILGLLAASLIAVPMVAQAQTETLDYQGYVMGGTSTTEIVPANAAPLQSAPVSTTATFDASVTFSGSLAQNDLVIDSYQINLTANNGASFEFQNLAPLQNSPFFAINGESECAPGGIDELGGCVTLTTSGNTVTGATFNLRHDGYHESVPSFVITIGPNGDAFSDSYSGVLNVNCGLNGDNSQGTFVGPASAFPCTMNVSNPTAGVWTAPEIDPATATSGLALLLGGVAVLRGRRNLKSLV
jgi:hypothetical protein